MELAASRRSVHFLVDPTASTQRGVTARPKANTFGHIIISQRDSVLICVEPMKCMAVIYFYLVQ